MIARLALCLLLAAPLTRAQDGCPFAAFEQFADSLEALGQTQDAAEREHELLVPAGTSGSNQTLVR